MSGGVDSSVAAALLKNQDFDVTGVFIKPWQPAGWKSCIWKEDREYAMRAAAKLKIKFLTWDLSKEYKKLVADYMIGEYRVGRTPNPDVMCNKEIKFGLFFKKAMRLGADFVATGHYVKAKREKRKTKNRIGYKLYQAKDKNKDQSYFLWTLGQKQLEKCLFPIGDYIKPEVRRIAKKFGLPNAAKKDSQGVCFIGLLNIKDFLKKYIKPKTGLILNIKGEKVGEHDGVFYYTIGQRHGLDIKTGKGPYFIVKKDIKRNIIYVGKEKDLLSKKARVEKINWIDGNIKLPVNLDVKIRYRTKSEKAVLNKNGELVFKKSVRAITSGQSAVFYRGQELLGGGIIQ